MLLTVSVGILILAQLWTRHRLANAQAEFAQISSQSSELPESDLDKVCCKLDYSEDGRNSHGVIAGVWHIRNPAGCRYELCASWSEEINDADNQAILDLEPGQQRILVFFDPYGCSISCGKQWASPPEVTEETLVINGQSVTGPATSRNSQSVFKGWVWTSTKDPPMRGDAKTPFSTTFVHSQNVDVGSPLTLMRSKISNDQGSSEVPIFVRGNVVIWLKPVLDTEQPKP